MSTSVQAIQDLLKLNASLFEKGVKGLSNAQALEQAAPTANPILWIAGHLASSRHSLLRSLGVEKEFPWGDLFNSKFEPSSNRYPDFAELVDCWKDISARVEARITELGDAGIIKPLEHNLPTDDKSVRGALTFWLYHDSWHMGQIAYAKKTLGLEGLVPY
jgi:uncharacterized damage-inducible protein DinB